ncbi:PKD domain-containing protein [bacterium]|nr:PKD domain-containing protein [bacterium]
MMNQLNKIFLLFLGLIMFGCTHNYEPVISQILADPNPASEGSSVTFICNASDDDDSSALKNESLNYTWYAAVGEIVSENLDNTATWIAPNEPGNYSISCRVSDESDGVDIGTIEVVVQ